MHPMLHIAIRAARNAGGLIRRSVEKVPQLTIHKKTKNDFVSEVDLMAEREIIQVIKNAYPEHSILAEESGVSKGNQYTWVIDPLDGTTNFLHGYPQYSVSIAFKNKNRTEIGVVYDPLGDELYTAEKGRGAMLNDRRIRVSKQTTLNEALIGAGFPFKYPQHIDTYLNMFKTLTLMTAGIRQAGSAALNLAYLSAGRLDGFWEIGLKEWDMAAGILLVQEAGGVVTDFSFNDQYIKSGNIITGNIKIHQALYKMLEPFVTEPLK